MNDTHEHVYCEDTHEEEIRNLYPNLGRPHCSICMDKLPERRDIQKRPNGDLIDVELLRRVAP